MKMTSPSVALQTGMELEQPYDNSRATTITKMIDKPSAVGKDDFLAKKSGSYKTNIADDRDVWCEYLAVVEMAVPANSGVFMFVFMMCVFHLQSKSVHKYQHYGFSQCQILL